MSDPTTDLHRLHERIRQTDPKDRYKLQPRLAELVEEMDIAGKPVPAEIRDLCEELTNEAIEARFDNMPV